MAEVFRIHTGNAELDRAVWEGDVERLCELAPCRCCCAEHTFESCPARAWSGCRGNGVTPRADVESWFRHYEQHHGMTRDEFFCWDQDAWYASLS